MANILVFGMGKRFYRYEEQIVNGDNVLAYIDNGKSAGGMYKGRPILDASHINDFAYDKILVVAVMGRMEIIRECLSKGVDCGKIIPWFVEGSTRCKQGEVKVLPTGEILISIHAISFLIKHDSDSFIYEEIFLQDEYAFSLSRTSIIVIDIGMNIGCASLFFASRENVAAVYSYEPFPQTYREALENFSRNEEAIRGKIVPHNYALSRNDGEIEVRFCEDFPGGMSILPGLSTYGGKQAVTVKIRKASSELKEKLEQHAQDMIVIKMDCEGSEYEILQDLDEHNLVRKVDVFIMESHLGREDELIACLKSNGFCVFHPYNGSGLGNIYAVNLRKRG